MLSGSLAPDGAVFKRAAASPSLFEVEGRAVAFEGLEDLAARIDDPALDVAGAISNFWSGAFRQTTEALNNRATEHLGKGLLSLAIGKKGRTTPLPAPRWWRKPAPVQPPLYSAFSNWVICDSVILPPLTPISLAFMS